MVSTQTNKLCLVVKISIIVVSFLTLNPASKVHAADYESIKKQLIEHMREQDCFLTPKSPFPKFAKEQNISKAEIKSAIRRMVTEGVVKPLGRTLELSTVECLLKN